MHLSYKESIKASKFKLAELEYMLKGMMDQRVKEFIEQDQIEQPKV